MSKHERPSSKEFEIDAKRSKKLKYAQLTSNPTGKSFTSIIFPDLAFFLKQLELSEEDVIGEYLSEANGEEILNLLESGYDRKSNELAVIFKVLATIIIRTRKDLNELYGEVGKRLAEGVLEDAPLAFCFRALKPQSSAEAAKASLQLLSAVVSIDPLLYGRSLLRSVNFEHPDWIQVSRRRNTKDPIDVRTCFINFIASFLVSENNLVIRELLESKNAISLLLGGCFTDKTENVLLILDLLRKCVCENPTVSKTIKMRIFTRNALKQLGYLYAYRGEALSEKSALARTDAEMDFQAVELVRQAVHSLLIPLVTSPLLGLVFRERASLESGGRQNNHLLFFILSPPMENAFTDNLRRQLVTECLLACPALLPSYLDQLSLSMAPRDTENWHNMMMFVNQLFSLFQSRLVARVSQLLELSQDRAEFVQSIADLCLPPSCIADVLNKSCQHESTPVVKIARSIYKTLRQNMRIFLTWLHTTEELKSKGTSAQPIIDALSSILPERIANEKWCKKFHKTLQKQHTDLSLLKSQILPANQEQTEDETVEESKNEREESSKLPQPEEVISIQPKKLRSSLRELLNLSDYPDSEFSKKKEKNLIKIWPDLTAACLGDFSSGSIVLLNCLATAIRIFSKNYWGDGGEELTPAPKILLSKIGASATFKSILFEEAVIKLDGDKQGTLPTLPLKAALLNLLLALAEVDPNSTAKNISTTALLATYKASLSICGKNVNILQISLDRHSLQLLHLLDLSGHPLAGIWGMTNRSVIWGSRILEHYLIGSTLGELAQLRREPNAGTFLSILDADKLLNNALTFPVTRRCLSRAFSADTSSSPLNPNLYDPCFLLPLFLQYLSSDDPDEELHPSRVDIRGFYSRGCLAFAVGALSSYSRHIRGLAKSVIARFRSLSEAWKPAKVASVPPAIAAMKQFPERIQLNFMLDCLRNSLSNLASDLNGGIRSSFLFGSKADTPFRLTRVLANFFINALTMLSKPEHRMYEVFWNAFMAKPAIDLGALPDFIRIIFSVHKDFRVERQWIVKLCADSLNDTSDYLLLEKSRVYKYCLVLYADPAVDTTTQIQILRLLTATTRIPRACHALTRFHAFPLWLYRHALSTTHAPSLCYFLTIIEQMRNAFEETKDGNLSPCLPMLRLLDATFRSVHEESTFSKRKIKRISA
ncbi:hypothetical protein Aperf_G00000002958 [Anoplocephala perfoliata]